MKNTKVKPATVNPDKPGVPPVKGVNATKKPKGSPGGKK